jgi:hypothetical protein
MAVKIEGFFEWPKKKREKIILEGDWRRNASCGSGILWPVSRRLNGFWRGFLGLGLVGDLF